MAKLITVYWRDIPAQVIVKERRDSKKAQLSERFAQAIDRAAMRAGKGGSDAYLEEWRRHSVDCEGDMQAIADETAAQLEQQYDKDRLIALVKNNGFEPEA